MFIMSLARGIRMPVVERACSLITSIAGHWLPLGDLRVVVWRRVQLSHPMPNLTSRPSLMAVK